MEERILIVDDEADIREILRFNLENAGFEVDCAASAEEALRLISPRHSLILLDVMMEGMSGFRMAEVLRREKENDIPVIFLTARNSELDLLTGFSAGGDDYICKPFSIHEVIARIKAVLRRRPAGASHSRIGAGAVQLDLEEKTVYVQGKEVAFSKKEFEILKLLAEHPGKMFSREKMIAVLWRETPYVVDRTVDVHIARIRSKLGDCKNYITNKSGYGYCFKATAP